jgi:polysaccharide biosynthesis/export protein
MRFKPALLVFVLLLSACGTLPRGAGLQSEVLAKQNITTPGVSGRAEDAAIPSEFAVEPITRDSLAKYARWPGVGGKAHSWIKRVDQPNTRIIAPGDTVVVSIWSNEENGLLTTPGQRFINLPATQVTSSGQIFLPYIGPTKVSGMSPEHARSVIEKAYTAVTPSAQVQITLGEGRQSSASVISGVEHPGAFPLADQDVTVLDILAAAGGVPAAIANPHVRLQRGSHVYRTSLHRLMEDTSLNTTLVGGDRVFVEPDDRYFLSLGAAGSRAQHRFTQDHISALDAMSIIGGLAADRANAQGILVLRNYPASAVRRDGSGPRNKRTIFTIDLTTADGLFSAGEFEIAPDDLIYVTESPLVGTRNVFSVIGSVFGLARQVEAISTAAN